VELVGIITSRDSFVDKEIITLDDSTGVVSCCLWTDRSSWSLHRVSLELNPLTQDKVGLGDLVRLRGKVRPSPGYEVHMSSTSWEISIHSIKKESDPNTEVLHWLEVMNLDKVYRRPFRVPLEISRLYERKTTFRAVLGSFLGFKVPLTMQELKVPIRTAVPRSGLPTPIPPFSTHSLMENDHIRMAAQAQAALVQSQGRNTTAVQELNSEIQHLIDVGDVLFDPAGQVIDYCGSCAVRTNIVEAFAQDAFAFAPENRPDERLPLILLSADLLVPVVYDIICTEYVAKSSSEEGKGKNTFWYGVKETQVQKAISQKHFPNIKHAHIHKVTSVLVELNWIYDVQDNEYRPVSIPMDFEI